MQRAYVIWADANGVTRQTVINTNAGVAGVLAQLQPLSWAQVFNYTDAALLGPLGLPAMHAYQSVRSAVALEFQTSAGTIVKITLPSPVLTGAVNPTGIFLADQQTVDPAQIAALIAAVTGSVTDPAGNLVTSFVGGYLTPGRNDLPPTK